MVVYKGGTVVERGLYWNPMDGQRVDVREDGILRGDESSSYLKVSPAGLLVMAPFIGMIYVMFLPLFGVGAFLVSWLVPVIGTLVAAAATGIRVCSRIYMKGVFFHWNPSRAYFYGVRKKKMNGGRDTIGVREGTTSHTSGRKEG